MIASFFTSNIKQAIYEAEKIALQDKSKEISIWHMLLAIFHQKGSVGEHILKDLLFEKKLNEIQKKINSKKIKLFHKKNKVKEKLLLVNSFQKNSKKTILFSKKLQEAFKKASKYAVEQHYPYLGTEHLVLAILNFKDLEIQKILKKTLSLKNTKKTVSIKQKNNKKKEIGKLNLNSFLKNSPFTNLNAGFSISNHLNKEKQGLILDEKVEDFLKLPKFIPLTKLIKNFYSPMPVENSDPLKKYTKNLNQEAKKKNNIPIIGREKEVNRLINVLARKTKNNPVLLGESGVGKTAIVFALAQKINQGEVPSFLLEKTIYEIDLTSIIAGTSLRGEFEKRIKSLIQRAENDPSVIFFIDEIHNLTGAGGGIAGSMDGANLLKPVLAQGVLKVIGATTFKEYRRYLEKDSALERRFQPIKVNEPSQLEAKKILLGIKKYYEEYHKVSIDPKAIDTAISLSVRYLPYRFLPDKAIDLIDEAQAKVKAKAVSFEMVKKIKNLIKERKKLFQLKHKMINLNNFDIASAIKKSEKKLDIFLKDLQKEQKRREDFTFLRITENDIKEIIAEITEKPLKEIEGTSPENLMGLSRKLQQAIIGQKNAIKATAQIIKRAISGVTDPNRPLGSFLFLGPTGTGKTYLSKKISELLFHNKKAFVRIDMSEFSQKHTISQLIGAPAGYIGYDDGGRLTESVRRNPYSIVLFDEIEKAHPDIFNILLQILEDGILTDGSGETVNFKNTIIILTSNLGTKEFLKNALGFEAEKETESKEITRNKRKIIMEELSSFLLPELLNRIDKIIIFNSLSKKDLAKITQKELQKINTRIKDKNVKLSFNKKTINFLADKSYSNKEGARLIRKNIENLILNPLSNIILTKRGRKPIEIKIKVEKNRIKLEN